MERQDTIERQITVARPIERMWEALTVAEELSQWFGDSADVDLRPDGAMNIGWSEYDAVFDCVIKEVDFPSTFSYRWPVGTTQDGEVWMTTVTFTLEEFEGMTTVTVVESGLSRLPDELYDRTLEENSSGWTAELADLQQHLEGAQRV